MTTKGYAKRSAIHRASKYALKNDPLIIELRYKKRNVDFRPVDLNLQINLDNFDRQIPQILDDLGYGLLNRNAKARLIQQIPRIMQDFTGLTLQNKYQQLVTLHGIDNDVAKAIFDKVVLILKNEGYPVPSGDPF